MDRGISTFQWSQRGDCIESEKNDVDQVRVFYQSTELLALAKVSALEQQKSSCNKDFFLTELVVPYIKNVF
jgi:hypothetical protein